MQVETNARKILRRIQTAGALPSAEDIIFAMEAFAHEPTKENKEYFLAISVRLTIAPWFSRSHKHFVLTYLREEMRKEKEYGL